MNTHALDSILDDTHRTTDDTEVITLVSRVISADSGTCLELKHTDVISGTVQSSLVRLREDGRKSVTLRFDDNPDVTEARVAQALLGDASTGVSISGSRVWSASDADSPLVDAINALAEGGAQGIFTTDFATVIQKDSTLHVITADGKAADLALAPLTLGGWRHLGAIHLSGSTLYVCVTDPVAGFDVFTADLGRSKPLLEPTLVKGAQRFAINAAVPVMCQTERGLLLGTAALAGPKQQIGDWGPELLLISEDGTWDLLIGQPRFTPSGFMLPASSLMPGLGAPANAAIKAMLHQDGETWIALQDFAGAPVEDRREVGNDLFEYSGQITIYRSKDLEEWNLVTEVPTDSIGAVTAMGLTKTAIVLGYEALGAHAIPVLHIPLS